MMGIMMGISYKITQAIDYKTVRVPLLDATWSTRRSWEALCLGLVACFGL